MKVKNKLIILAVIILVLNLIWEFSHYRLYVDLTGIPGNLHLIMASLMDLVIICIIFAVNSLLNKNVKWIEKPEMSDYSFIIIFCILTAVFIEKYSLAVGKWAYTSSMPVIAGIGLSPLAQLFITAIVGLFLIKLIK